MANRPNILLIMTDQHNARCMGCAGEPLLQTPNMDRLASEGVRFTNAFANSAHCGHSRLSFLAGIYEHTHQKHRNTDEPPDSLNPITSLLKTRSYQTAIVGKGHLGIDWPRREFEHHVFSEVTDAVVDDPLSSDYIRYLVDAGQADNYDLSGKHKLHSECAHTSPLPVEHSAEVWCGNESVSYLQKRDRDRPFFAMASVQRPHDPLSVSVPYDTMYEPGEVVVPANANDTFENKSEKQKKAGRGETKYPYRPRDKKHLQKCIAHYYGLITLIDQQIGHILEELENQGILEDTIVIYTSDHGDFAGEHGLIWKNLGFYESIHKIPLIIRYPHRLKGNQVFDGIVESVDLYPTLMELLGLETPFTVQGRSVLHAVAEGAAWNKYASLCEHVKPSYHHMSMRTADFRLTIDITGDESELYDQRNDPGELYNLWNDSEYRDIREKLLFELVKFRTCPPLLYGNPPESWRLDAEPGYYQPVWCQEINDFERGKPWSEIRGDN